jgi:DNA invertase Pin-like site-specific DNA recombinase
MLVGYARVSTEDQTSALQLDALKAAGCERIFEDKGISGAVRARPGLDDALAALQAGDVLVVWRLDRLARSLADLLAVVEGLRQRGCGFRSLTESIDTDSAGGTFIMQVFGALAEFERNLIAERTRAGLAAAKRRGARLGRRPALTDGQVDHARALIAQGESPTLVARSLKVGRSTLYRALAA